MIRQRTLKSVIRATGIGLHSGARVDIGLRPAPPNTGIVFCRTDLPGMPTLKADAGLVGDTRLCSTLEQGEATVGTVEHLMAALAGLGIDNAYVDLSAPEVPIMDGSSAPFVFLLQSAGIEMQPAPKKFIRIKKPVEVVEQDKWVRFEPYAGFRIDFTIDFTHPVINGTPQHVLLDFGKDAFAREMARARTFGFLRDVERLRAMGLALGGGTDNAIVLDDYRMLNDDGLRYPDEFVRHKALDALGDLYLMGHAVIGAYSAYRSGHALNNQLARTLLAQADAWELVSFEHPEETPSPIWDLFGQIA